MSGEPKGLTEDEVVRLMAVEGMRARFFVVEESYLAGDISFGRAAELLGMTRWELADTVFAKGRRR